MKISYFYEDSRIFIQQAGGEIGSALVFRRLIFINTHIHIQAATHPQVHQRSYCIMCSLLGAALCDILHKVKGISKEQTVLLEERFVLADTCTADGTFTQNISKGSRFNSKFVLIR